MKGLMKSPGHRRIIMSKDSKMFGSARSQDANGKAYYTQLFIDDGKPARNLPDCAGKLGDGGDAAGNKDDGGGGDGYKYDWEFTNSNSKFSAKGRIPAPVMDKLLAAVGSDDMSDKGKGEGIGK